MKKFALVTVLGVSIAFLILLAFLSFGRSISQSKLPVYPDTISKPGTYWIDSDKYVRIHEDKGKIIYREGVVSSRTRNFWGVEESAIVVEGTNPGVSLTEGWRIGMERPETIVIELRNGTMTRRSFGDSEFSIESIFGPDQEEVINLHPEEFKRQFDEIKNKMLESQSE